jgi:esterase/lipase superfamily enzyme
VAERISIGVFGTAIVALCLLSGCANRTLQGALIPVTEAAEGAAHVPIVVATTRRRVEADMGQMFSGERGDGISYAAITVSIPPDGNREVGKIQWPTNPPGDPRRNFVTVSAQYLEKPGFSATISTLAKKTKRNKVLVFVHGFNTRFDDAVYRLAQITYDSKAAVIPVLFTWPSRGKLRAYAYDRESANYSRDALDETLELLTRNPNVTEIVVLAHSMGNWVTLEALRTRAIRTGRISDKVKNVMLVAPDVDVDVFRTQINRMGSPRPRFALFVSQDDKALKLSQTIWGDVPRLGEVDPNQEPYRTELEQEKILVFDLTSLKSGDGTGHDKAFEDVTSVVSMIRQRLGQGQKLDEQDANAAE